MVIFTGCINLETINFNDTKAEWKAYSKVNLWEWQVGDFIVVCTNGKLDKNGNEIE